MSDQRIAGTWLLETWRRMVDADSVVYPLGERPRGILVYTADGSMVVQMSAADRPRLNTDDPVGGTADERASAYSTCLAYFGTYEVLEGQVVHHVDSALFPNWSDTHQSRPFVLGAGTLSLQVRDPSGRVTNEIIWRRKGS